MSMPLADKSNIMSQFSQILTKETSICVVAF